MLNQWKSCESRSRLFLSELYSDVWKTQSHIILFGNQLQLLISPLWSIFIGSYPLSMHFQAWFECSRKVPSWGWIMVPCNLNAKIFFFFFSGVSWEKYCQAISLKYSQWVFRIFFSGSSEPLLCIYMKVEPECECCSRQDLFMLHEIQHHWLVVYKSDL